MRRASGLLCFYILALTACGGGPGGSTTTKKEDAARYNVQLGLAYLQKGELALAKEKLERAEKQNPRDPQLQSSLGMLYERLGEPQQADRYYRQALRMAPDDPEVQNNYAIYLCRQKRVDEGVEKFMLAASNPLYRTPEAALTNAGVCLREAKRFDEAAARFTRALAVRPNFSEAAYQLGDLELERGRNAEAKAVVTRYLDAFRPTPDVLLLAVRVSRASNDRLAEERYARRLRVDFPESPQARALGSLPDRKP